MSDLMNKLISLCKRRGFIFQSSEVYGGLKSCYDYGPLGVELKKNIAQAWWKNMVYERDSIYGMDASILMHSDVWKASGHLANFSDPLVDCLTCQERFRADKAPKHEPGLDITYGLKEKKKGQVGPQGYVCPRCSSPSLSDERQFRLMFRSTIGPVDPLNELVDKHYGQLSLAEFKSKLSELELSASSVYLRPETAQAMFVQFLNVQQSMSAKVPFGIAQCGKAFRNEIITEHFIFRSCEFEQMELEFFCEPGSQTEWMEYWKQERMNWHKIYARHPENYRLRAHDKGELAHYSDGCFDVEYKYPWGWDELEGIASRTDFDLSSHSKKSGAKLSYFDPQKTDPATGKTGWRYTPYVIEPSLGLTRSVLCFLLDAYCEEGKPAKEGEEGGDKTRIVLKLHPQLAPYKAAVLPLVKKDGQPEFAKDLVSQFRKKGIPVSYDENNSIGKRYARHDEIGTPFCITIDQKTIEDGSVTLRDRDSTLQERLPAGAALERVLERLNT